ncbi:MAG TPA: gamma-glutamylcyclotransferase family protein [Lysobacter sp.]
MIERLFVYGSLAPGRPNAHVLERVPGTWQPAVVRGTLREEGWGAAMGFPGLVLDPNGDDVHGQVFMSQALSAHWARVDAFEGDGYRRVATTARLEDGREVEAWVYAIRQSGDQAGA